MQKTRKAVIELMRRVESIKERYISIEKDIFTLLSNKPEFDRTVAHYDAVIAELEKELKLKPIGYRYTGVYYLKKPYTMPVVFEKGFGSLYMIENLVSWQVEKEPGVRDYTYHRAVYKEIDGPLLTREDAEPVYQN